MGGKRANGEGSIYQRSDGRWCSAIVADDPATGQRHRTVLYGKTRTEVRQKLKAATERAEAGGPVRDAKATVAAWLAQWRATALEASTRKPTTKELYSSLCRKHLEPEPFGARPLDRLRPVDVDALIIALREKDLADSTVRQVYTVLRLALDDAMRDGLLASNVAAKVKRPKVTQSEARYLPTADVKRLLQAAEKSRYHAVLTLIAGTGLRKGEALALTWADIDFDAATLRVRGTLSRVGKQKIVTEPKTEKSRRTLPLSPAMVALLKRHRASQRADQLRAGSEWAASGHVFASQHGTPLEPRAVLRALASAAKAAGITDANVHTLRHSAATGWIENGVSLKAVSEALGHSSIAITGDVYAHVSEQATLEAMTLLSDAIGV